MYILFPPRTLAGNSSREDDAGYHEWTKLDPEKRAGVYSARVLLSRSVCASPSVLSVCLPVCLPACVHVFLSFCLPVVVLPPPPPPPNTGAPSYLYAHKFSHALRTHGMCSGVGVLQREFEHSRPRQANQEAQVKDLSLFDRKYLPFCGIALPRPLSLRMIPP